MIRAILAGLAAVFVAAAVHAQPVQAFQVAAYGDSLTAGNDWFIAPIPGRITMLDEGEVGDECYNDITARAITDIGTTNDDVLDSRYIVVFCGTNDVREGGYTLAATTDVLTSLQTSVAAIGIGDSGQQITLIAVVPPPIYDSNGDTEATFNSRIEDQRTFLKANGFIVADVYQAFLDEIAAGTPNTVLYTSPDFVHPTGRGRTLMAVTIWNTINPPVPNRTYTTNSPVKR